MDTPPPLKRTTAWHPPFVRALRAVLLPECYEIFPELQLNQQPQRIDVVVRKRLAAVLLRSGALAPLVAHLGPITLIEFKGPTVSLQGEDLLVLLGYAYQYRVLKDAARDQIHLMVVANHLTKPFRTALLAEGAVLTEEAPGVHAVRGLAHPLCVIETAHCGDHLLALFSQHMTQSPQRLFTLLNEEERTIFRAVYQEVQRFRTESSLELKYTDTQEMTMSMKELMELLLEDTPKEDLLNHLSPEDMLKRLSPEDRLRGLSPEDLLRGLSPEGRQQLKKLLA